MSMDFSSDWMLAKRLFEAATDKKKPGKKFLGAFKMSSGVENACKEMEKAIAQPSADRIAKAEKTFAKASEDYLKVLRKAAADEDATDTYKMQLAKLEKTLEQIRLEFSNAKRTEIHDLPMDFADIVPENVVNGLAKSTFAVAPVLIAFATKPQFAVSGADGKTKLPAAIEAQSKAKQALKDYAKASTAMKSQAKKRMDRKEAWKNAGDLIGDAAVAVGTGGFQGALAYWQHAQQEAFGPARQPDFDAWFKSGPLATLIKAVGDACTAEAIRLNGLEGLCNQQEKQPR